MSSKTRRCLDFPKPYIIKYPLCWTRCLLSTPLYVVASLFPAKTPLCWPSFPSEDKYDTSFLSGRLGCFFVCRSRPCPAVTVCVHSTLRGLIHAKQDHVDCKDSCPSSPGQRPSTQNPATVMGAKFVLGGMKLFPFCAMTADSHSLLMAA
ncbi:hypothetical protein B0H63DRAFT_161276 [Podospora didyma]|uniref:Uncharacterized protein n=1 Tax=Podospora didyma TaxID=330526 RepID=A0AAE0NU09_9PEZI|nr:hypothetical protein B0H63DRAFT_161276 [Podospora didyma]